MVQIGDITIQDEAVRLPVNTVVGASRDTSLASGTQAITGFGFRPSSVLCIAGQGGSNEISIGVDDGTTDRCLFKDATLSTFNTSATALELRENGGGTRYSGVITSYDVDGFTITWTRTGSPTGNLDLTFMAFK
jgi:hypothetical protein